MILLVQILVFWILYGFKQMEVCYAIYSSLVLIALFMLLGIVILKTKLNIK